MSRLRVYDQREPTRPIGTLFDHDMIAQALGEVGVRFERWAANKPVAPGASQDDVIAAYHDDIQRLQKEQGYTAVDVISLASDHPQKDALRQKFLSEHTHAEDEVRFFVAGQGQFTLHIGQRIYDVLCEKGDLIGVPDGTRHWFDMGPNPNFIAIRLFTNPEGWVAKFTGEAIAERFPRLEN
ncbi:MAG TPA: acireductone dioxygenase [Rhodanobacteraceae bacterium]|nr:acireductone dioxygenase [Rhodanobacteraceae bacterium]